MFGCEDLAARLDSSKVLPFWRFASAVDAVCGSSGWVGLSSVITARVREDIQNVRGNFHNLTYQHYSMCLGNANIIDWYQHFPNSFSVGNEIKPLSSSNPKSNFPREGEQISPSHFFLSLLISFWSRVIVRGLPPPTSEAHNPFSFMPLEVETFLNCHSPVVFVLDIETSWEKEVIVG